MNLVLISLDTLRADRLRCYGHHRLTSPNIDRVASEGALFESHYSPHIPTYPGHTTMMTGRDVYAHQVTCQSQAYLPTPGVPMLAEILKTAGYYTSAADNLGKWFTRGFDVYESYTWDTSLPEGWRKAEAVNETAMRVLRSAAAQSAPFFVFLHYWDAHTPYLPPRPFHRLFYTGDETSPENRSMDQVWACEEFRDYFREWMPDVTDIEFPKAQYDAEIAYMDTCLGHILNLLDDLRLSDDTLLVMTADHGEEFDEHGCWFDHHGLYETNTRIPLILRLPGAIRPGVRVPGLTRMTDLTPTIVDYLEVPTPDMVFDGRSLRPLIEDPQAATSGICEAIHLTENTWMKKRGIRTREWKLIRALEPDLHGFAPIELYDMTHDPAERDNRAADRPDVVDALSEQMDRHIAARVAAADLPDPLPLQPIPLRRIGKAPAATKDTDRTIERSGDDKRPDGDFVGYVRDERTS